MKHAKKLLAILLVGVMLMGTLVACGGNNGGTENKGTENAGGTENNNSEEKVEVVKHKIGVAHYTDSGKGYEAIKAYLEGISEVIGCEFEYVTLSTYDEATNITAIQNLISAGCEGILMSADMGTAAIMAECEAAGVYLAGFLCDYLTSKSTTYDEVFGSEYFLGTVCDGYADPAAYGEAVAADVIAKGYKNVGVITFPAFAYPLQANGDAAFRAAIAKHNETAEEKINIIEETHSLMFAPLEDTYLSDNPDLDCIFSLAAGAGFVSPVLVANNKTDIALYTTGFEGTDDMANFGSNGNGCFKGVMACTAESIVYPLVLMIDALNGTRHADLPAAPEVVPCDPLVILSDEDMKTVEENSIYYSANYADALITGEEIIKLCASYNEDATYAGLVELLSKMGVEDLK